MRGNREAWRRAWIDAFLLPGERDPLESCLRELSEYTGRPPEEVRALCEGAVERQAEVWRRRERRSDGDIVAFYDECDAYLYELMWWHALQAGDSVVYNARLLELAREGAGLKYLDFGAGVGTNGVLFGRAGFEVTLADVSGVLQKFCRWRLEKRGLSARLLDLRKDALPKGAFDFATAVDVLEHVPDPLVTLGELRRCLRPEGILAFNVIATKDPSQPFHLLESKYPIRSSIRALGFRIIERHEKFLVCKRVERSALANRLLGIFDRLRWRVYYLASFR